MNNRDFDEMFEESRRDMARARRFNTAFFVIMLLLIVATTAFTLIYPEKIGGYVGRVVSGFEATR